MSHSLKSKVLKDLNKSLTPTAVILLQKIGEFRGKQVLYPSQQAEKLDKMQIESIITNTVASNAIDGIEIPHSTFMDLFEEVKVPEDEIESELSRYVKVLNLIQFHFETLDVSPETILQFHRNLFRYKENQGGRWKPLDNVLDRSSRDGERLNVFIPISAQETPDFMKELCLDYNLYIDDQEIPDLVVIAAFIHDFLCCHPFTSGNGRLARLLTQFLLLKQGYQVAKYISIDEIYRENKAKYFYALNRADYGWHEDAHRPAEWVEFFLWGLYTAYYKMDKHLFSLPRKKGAKSQQVKTIIESLPDTFKVSDIADKAAGISRPTINKVLQEMRDERLIKPCSLGRDAIWKKL